jgi:hypothetical protein
MRINLIKTPEYEYNSFREVFDFLNSFDGVMQFIASDYQFDQEQFPFLKVVNFDSSFQNKDNIKTTEFTKKSEPTLTWEQLFSLCDYYRATFNVEPNDFVVLLTTRRNNMNWFSHFKNRNAFVHSDEWKHFINAHPKYPIAYQIVENVMQALMRLDLVPIPSTNIHLEPKGCMNDFCYDKRQIILKLRTADLCPDCIEKIKRENIDHGIVNQVLNIFRNIRDGVLFLNEILQDVRPVPIIVNENQQIILPKLNNLEIQLYPLLKTLYIFYLKHTDGVRLNELNDFRAELLAIYKRLSPHSNIQSIERRIDDLVNPIGSSFSQKKSRLNRIITDLLGEPLARFYRIEGKRGEPFKINIPRELIDIRY